MSGEAQTTQPHTETIRRVHGRGSFICRTRKGLKMLDALERVLKGLKPVGRFSLPGFDRNQFVAILLPGNGRGCESAMPHGTSALRINPPSPYVCRCNKRQPGVSRGAQFMEHMDRAAI